MIEFKDVCMRFDDKDALKHISLTIYDGETLAIIGGSGSGKSTFLRLLIGLIKPTSGQILIDGQDIVPMSEAELNKVRLKMGMVFQYSALFDSMTVGENVAFGLREHTKLSDADIKEIVREKLHLVGLDGVEDMMPNELSGGMKKRVSLARAIAVEPSIICYDEPSSGLDPLMTEKIDELIINTQKALSVTSIVVTHDMASACRISDRIAMIYEGELIAIDTPSLLKRLDGREVGAQMRDALRRRQQGHGGGAHPACGARHQDLAARRSNARLFQRQHAEHGGEAGGADAHGLPLIQPGRQRHQPVGLDPRLFGHAAPVSFPHTPTGQYHLVTALVAAVGRLQHCADEVDARHQRPLAHYLALAGDGQPVLVVEGAVAHRHPHLPRRQLALGQLGQGRLGLAILVIQ